VGNKNLERNTEKRNQAPYLGAFQSLKAISCKNLSAGIVRFPPCCMARKERNSEAKIIQ